MLDAILEYKSFAQNALLIAAAVAAWRWGAGPERATAFVLVVVLWLADLALHKITAARPNFASVEMGHFFLDALAFSFLFGIALTANRIYPLCMTVIQGVVVMTHFAAEAVRNAPLAYSILSIAPSYLLIFLLMGGVWLHRQRRQQFGPYRAWRREIEVWASRRAKAR